MLEQSVSPNHRTEKIAEIEGAFVMKRMTHVDERGMFAEIYGRHFKWPEGFAAKSFVQLNHSFNFAFSLRGMHLQQLKPQGKLVTCTYGTVLDVLFDVRADSATYLKGFSTILDFESLASIYVPPGVLHGFLALSKFSVINYMCTTMYDPFSQAGIRWDSPELKELWMGYCDEPTVSVKDRSLPTLAEFLAEPK